MSSTSLTTFNFHQHGIRVVTIEGAPWFVATDVCRVLEIYMRHDGPIVTVALGSSLMMSVPCMRALHAPLAHLPRDGARHAGYRKVILAQR